MKRWNRTDDNTIRRGLSERKTYARIAAEMGLTEGQVRGRARAIGCQKYAWLTDDKRAEIVSQVRAGRSDAEVARDYKLAGSTVRRMRQSAGIPPRNRGEAARETRRKNTPDIALQQQSQRTALELVSSGPRTIGELVLQSGLGKGTLRHRLQRLRKKGLVICEGTSGPGMAKWFSLGWWLEHNRGLVHLKAKEIHRLTGHISFEDVHSELVVRIIKNVSSFRPVGVRFATYGLRWAVLETKTWAANERSRGVYYPNHLGIVRDGLVRVGSIVCHGSSDPDEGGDDWLPDREDSSPPVDPEFWDRAVVGLPPRLKRVVLGHFRDQMTYGQLGRELGCSKGRVEQLVRKAEEKMRSNVYLKDYTI